METITLESLKSTLSKRGGTLKRGKHSIQNGECCALELVCAVRQCDPPEDLSDDPNKVDMPDIRAINDACWSTDELRTEHMLPVIAAYAGWSKWTKEKRSDAMKKVALENIRQTLPLLLSKLGFENEAIKCREATDLKSAESAAEYAAKYAAKYAAESAESAAKYAAKYAAESAESAAKYAAKSAAESATESAAKYAAKYAAESAAKYAAKSAAKYAAESAAKYAAKSAAEYAAEYAKSAALKDEILIITCKIWVEAVK